MEKPQGCEDSALRYRCFKRKTGTGVPCPYNFTLCPDNLVWVRLGGGALRVQGEYLLGYLFYVGDAE